MQREIKFRAWDERKKVMHHQFEFIKSGDGGDDWICFASDEEPGETNDKAIILDNPYCRQQLHIMQFTGLHDKQGEDLYEGDLIRSGAGELLNVSDVRFVGNGFWCVNKSGNNWLPNEFEIIGNVHQNPELLK